MSGSPPVDLRTLRRILVIRRKALGDALVTLPAVLRLAAACPRARIDLVIDRPYAPLFASLASGLSILAWPPAEGGGLRWLDRLRAARYDLAIDYLGSPRTAAWTALSGARWRVGYDLRGRRWAYNVRVPRNAVADLALVEFAGEAFLDPLRALGLDAGPWRPGRGATVGDRDGLGEAYLRWRRERAGDGAPDIALVFSATWPSKAWPAGHVARLFRLLAESGTGPLIVTGPGDEELARDLADRLPPSAFAPPTSLLELADLLAGSNLFVGTDCGARHLAACLGRPTVTLFGPTDPRGWNPEDPDHAAVRTGVACSPCDLTRCPVAGHPCLDLLQPEIVLAAVRRIGERHGWWRRAKG